MIDFIQWVVRTLMPDLGLPLLGVVIGGWLTTSFFPFRLKRREWRWEKEVWAKELFIETLSRISFIAEHYFKSDYQEQFSMSGLTLNDTEKEITRLVKELHGVGHKLKLYLKKSDAVILGQYLHNCQTNYNAASESWMTWQQDDHLAPTKHTESTIASQGEVALRALEKIKLSS
jgi:hypothetical protein